MTYFLNSQYILFDKDHFYKNTHQAIYYIYNAFSLPLSLLQSMSAYPH